MEKSSPQEKVDEADEDESLSFTIKYSYFKSKYEDQLAIELLLHARVMSSLQIVCNSDMSDYICSESGNG
jgi:hypothetical protein